MKNIFKFFSFLTLLATVSVVSNSCVHDDDYGTPPIECNLENWVTPNATLGDIIALNPTSTSAVQITIDLVFEAYVSSSDETGNIYKILYIQDAKVNPTYAISINIDKTNTYVDFPVGAKVRVRAKGLSIATKNSTLQMGIGGSLDRIPQTEVFTYVRKTCDATDVVTPITVTDIATAKNNQYLNKLIKIENVQFAEAELGQNYAISSPATTINRVLEDVSGNMIVRNSGFATFADVALPTGKGTIIGVMSKYGSDWQLFIRSVEDVNMTGTRLDFYPPKGGTAITYSGSFVENFESYATGAASEAFPKYVNDAEKGSKYWRVATFSSNKYIQMSAFSSSTAFQEQNNRTLFIVPIDFTAATKLSFKTKDGFYNGGVLKVYTTTNYTPLGDVNSATLTDITSNFSIASGTVSGYAANFTDSGVYSLPSTLMGNGFVVFEYKGGYSFSPALTTTMQIDDITVANN